MIANIASPKWEMDEESASQFIVDSCITPDGNKWESWDICGFQFLVRYPVWPDGSFWKTDSGRRMGLVTGKKLGGYVGVSHNLACGSYHIGTPVGMKSFPLIAAMKRAMKAEKGAGIHSAE